MEYPHISSSTFREMLLFTGVTCMATETLTWCRLLWNRVGNLLTNTQNVHFILHFIYAKISVRIKVKKLFFYELKIYNILSNTLIKSIDDLNTFKFILLNYAFNALWIYLYIFFLNFKAFTFINEFCDDFKKFKFISNLYCSISNDPLNLLIFFFL